MKNLVLALTLMLSSASGLSSEKFHALKYTSIQGKEQSLSAWQGKVLLVVNTASECGYTSQYEGLEKLHKKYQAKGFTVIGFPSPSFDQELKTDKEVAEFCKLRYGVTFPLAKRVSVKGKDIDPVFDYLTRNAPEKGAVKWNFEKFLVDRKGRVVGRYPSSVKPEELATAIEKQLQ
ncbi:glutathione peroxidase [Oligoflexus tunisiensis]|uniref:glutathione peroxidase n=1 Tax=Oligoflexus tunisiensis TaxID=708132 RepID=UPI000A40D6FC|nr:glutathione peroxidase [Oligoflexus tunisiensis]